jgi:hypothetical protein
VFGPVSAVDQVTREPCSAAAASIREKEKRVKSFYKAICNGLVEPYVYTLYTGSPVLDNCLHDCAIDGDNGYLI